MSMLSVPLKTVLMYHADLQNEVIAAEGYEICDGRLLTSGQQDINPGSTYQLPNLLNKFILGADPTKAAGNAGDFTVAGASGAPGPKGTGGANSKTLATAELPAHTHTGSVSSSGTHSHSGSLSSSGAHTHAGSTSSTNGAHVHAINDPGHAHIVGREVVSLSPGGTSYAIRGSSAILDTPSQAATTGISIVSNGDHSHTLTIVSDGAHTHTLTVDVGGAHTHTFTSDATGSGTGFDYRPAYYGLVFIMKVKR